MKPTAEGETRGTMRYKNVSGGWLLAAPAAACCSHHHPAAMGERPAVQPTHPKRPPAPALVPNAILFISRRQAKGELASLARPHLETVQAGRPCWVGCLWSRTDDKLLRRPWAGVALVQHTRTCVHTHTRYILCRCGQTWLATYSIQTEAAGRRVDGGASRPGRYQQPDSRAGESWGRRGLAGQ